MEQIDTSPEIEAAQARFLKLQVRASDNFGYGATVEGLRIAETCYERLAEVISAKMDEPVKPSKGWDEGVHRLLKCIAPQVIALVAIKNTLDAVMAEKPYMVLCEHTGRLLNHELFALELRQYDEELTAEITEWVKQKHGNLKYRLQAARSLAKKGGFSFVNTWKPTQHVAVGNFVIDIVLQTLPDLFVSEMMGDVRVIRVTDGAMSIAEKAMNEHVRRFPVFLPSVEPPVPWTDFDRGGPVDPVVRRLSRLVRSRHRETIHAVKEAIRSGQMKPAMDALNAVQATGWKINTYLLNVIRECKRRGIEVEGLPSDTDVPMPVLSQPWEDLSDEEKKLARQERSEIKRENRTLMADRLRYVEDMETAEALSEHEAFYIPHNLDWRGREYPMTGFNFQREDRVRALFLFRDGEPIGEEGIQWLKVHVANCGDFEKVSKKSYEERIKWVDANISAISNCAVKDWEKSGPLSPTALEFWTKADKPFLFLAACVELTKALSFGPEYVCSLPVSWDGSCSGAQHLCAATRSMDAWKVNLTDVETPNDLYTIVSNAAKQTMKLSSDPLASTVLAYDGDWRKVFKRNTMTTFYGSKKFGMAQQHMDDLMQPLKREVLKKKRAVHPFGQTGKEHHAAARFLAHHASNAIVSELPLPMKAMGFLQDLAAVMAHAGKPLEWTTPVGLPWSNRYHASNTQRICLWLHDHGVRVPYKPLIAEGHQKDIDKNRAVNGVAPNFVHACDAAHLLLTVNRAAGEGINQFALVHDSFGCLPSQTARFQGIIREAFVMMYEKHDVLTEVLERAKCALGEHNDRLSEIAEQRKDLTGKLNIKEVLNAAYAFA
jgi:DNA-directed RNA polymerase